MKTFVLLFFGMVLAGLSQAQVNTYSTLGSDFIWSYANLETTGSSPQLSPRFSGWFHLSETFHIDLADHFGFFTGIGVTNIGFIAEYTDTLNVKKKYRTYNLGVPVGFKVGDMYSDEPLFFFAGASIDAAFHYKEKTFINDKKIDKMSEWMSNRVNILQPSFFIGFALRNKSAVKIQYYFMDYMNTGFTETVGAVQTKPYDHLIHSNLILISYGTSITGVKDF